jgi:transposase InsO family protein
MKKVYEEARGNPGVRRMRAGLAALGHLVSHKRVHRLMQAAGLRGRHPRAWRRTTIGGDKPVLCRSAIRFGPVTCGFSVVRRHACIR